MVGNLPGIRIGATLNMEADDPTLGADTYRCRIEDFSGDRLTLTWPSKRGQSVKLAVEDSVSLAMAQAGSDGQPTATIYLDCVVVDRLPPSPGNPVALVVVRVLAAGRQAPRGSYRLPVTIPLTECAVRESSYGAATWKPVCGFVHDISGGGLGLTLDEEVAQGLKLRVRFPVPMGSGEMAVTVEVMNVIDVNPGERLSKFKVGVKFDDATGLQRERMARAVHRSQVENRRRDQAAGRLHVAAIETAEDEVAAR